MKISTTKTNYIKTALAFLSVMLCLIFTQQTSAQTNTWDGSAGNGNWNTASNWSLNLVPTNAHDVVIPNNVTTTITVNTATAFCKTLTINGGTQNQTLAIGANNLTVTGLVTINAVTTTGRSKIITITSGTLSCGSVSMAATGTTNRNSEIDISTGIINVSGNITMNDANDFIRFSSSGTLNLGGNLSGGIIVPSTGTFNCNGAAAQTIGSAFGPADYSFYNFTLNKTATANTVTSSGNAFQVGHDLTVTIGNLILTATDASYTVSNDITVPSTGILTDNVNWDGTHLLSVGGDISIDGIFNYTSGTPHVTMVGAGAKTVRNGYKCRFWFWIFDLANR